MKKTIALLLTLLMLLSFLIPVASAAGKQNFPNIYIRGTSLDIYNAEGKEIYPEDDVELSAILQDKELVSSLLSSFAASAVTGNWDPYCDELSELLIANLPDMGFDKDGNLTNGSYANPEFGFDANGKPIYWSADRIRAYAHPWYDYELWEYNYCYDWRIDFYEQAEMLHTYIETVLAATGCSQVNLIGLCYGGGLMNAYLEKYGAEGKVNTAIYYVSCGGGISAANSLLTGKIKLNSDVVERWLNNYTEVGYKGEDPILTGEIADLLTSFLNFANQVKLLGLGMNLVEKFWDCINEKVLPRVARCNFGGFPSMYENMSGEYYEDAINFMFGKKGSALREEYAGFIAKTDRYYQNVSKDLYANVKKFHDEYHIKTACIAHYGATNFPFLPDADEPSDNLCSLKCQTIGATVGTYSRKLSDTYIKNAEAEGRAKYISPDRMVDLSTAAMPDRTWVIGNVHHDLRYDYQDNLILTICRSADEMTVENSGYPRFSVMLEDENGQPLGQFAEMTAETNIDHISKEEDPSRFSPLKAFFDFISRLWNFIKNLLNANPSGEVTE